MQRIERVVAVAHLPKANEGVHLVDVTAHRLRHLARLQHVGVERIVPQPRLVHEPPEQPIKEDEPLRVGVQHHGVAQLEESGRNGDPAFRRFRALARGLVREQVIVSGSRRPEHLLGRHAAREQRTRLAAEAGEVRLVV